MESGDMVAVADIMTDLGLDGKEIVTKLVTGAGDLDTKPSEIVKQDMTEAIDLGRLVESIEMQALSVKQLVAVLRSIEEGRAADDHRLKEAEIQLKGAHLQAVTGRMDREGQVWEDERRERQRDRAWKQLGWFARARYTLMGKGSGSLELDTASSYGCCGCCVRANSDHNATAVRGVTESTAAAATGVVNSSTGVIAGTTSTITSSPLVGKSATLDGAPFTTVITTTGASASAPASAATDRNEGEKEEDEKQIAALTVESKSVEGLRRGKRSAASPSGAASRPQIRRVYV